jgi:hypothetical protein
MEALHHQTCDFPWWSRMMGGSYLIAFMVIICLALVRDNRWAGLLVEYRRYLQIWTFMVLAITEMLLFSVGWWRSRYQDWHVLLILLLATNHARVSLMGMTVHPIGLSWRESNWIATAVDAVILLTWTFWPHRIVQSAPKSVHAVA